MTIGIDLRPINTGEKSGVEEYTSNLLAHLLFLDKKNQYKFFLSALGKPRLNLNKLKKFPNVETKYFPYPNKLLNFSFAFFHHPQIDKMLGGSDIFFSPNIIFSEISSQCKQIITFHDLSFKRHPEFFSFKRKLWHKLVFPESQARKATKIIAVSHSTRRDLIQLYNLDPDKIEVIYSGVLRKFKPRSNHNKKVLEVQNKYQLPKRFILYLGTLEPRKNLASLILAFNNIKKKFPDHKLVIAGKPGWLYKNVYKLAFQSPHSRDIIFTGFISARDKPFLYNLAEIFVYPSFYEGFGFPPLEAMASGIPVITSSLSSLPEVIRDSAILIDPYNINEVGEAMAQLLENRNLKEFFRKKGIKRAKKFSWRKTAQKTLDLFEEVNNQD